MAVGLFVSGLRRNNENLIDPPCDLKEPLALNPNVGVSVNLYTSALSEGPIISLARSAWVLLKEPRSRAFLNVLSDFIFGDLKGMKCSTE